MQIKQIEWFDNRFYKVELHGQPTRFIPSVTTKLGIIDKPFLSKWRGDIGNREADMRVFEAAERGTRIHHAYDVLQKGGVIIYNPWNRPTYTKEEIQELEKNNTLYSIVKYQDEMLQVYKLHQFIEIVKPKILLTEMTVVNLDENDAGTVDAVYEIKEGNYLVDGSKPLFIPGGIYVADLKTGKTVDKSAYRQTAAYLQAIKKMKLYEPIGTMILHTASKNRSGIEGFGVEIRNEKEALNDYKEYRLISDLWEIEHKDDYPKLIEFPSILKIGGSNGIQ